MDCSPASSSAPGILQSRILEWVAIPFSRGSSRPRDQTQVSCTAADSLPSEPITSSPYVKLQEQVSCSPKESCGEMNSSRWDQRPEMRIPGSASHSWGPLSEPHSSLDCSFPVCIVETTPSRKFHHHGKSTANQNRGSCWCASTFGTSGPLFSGTHRLTSAPSWPSGLDEIPYTVILTKSTKFCFF